MATVFMTVYGKAGLARTRQAESLESPLPGRQACRCIFEARSSTNSWRARTASTPEQINQTLLGEKIIGGLPLERFYPELEHGSALRHRNEYAAASSWTQVAEAYSAK